MASSIRRNLAALVISLAFMVISLPISTFALVAPPEVNTRGIMVVTDGLKAPAGLALDAEGNIYVTDPVKRGVVMFNKYGKQIMFFKTQGLPQRVAVSSNGNGSVLVSQGSFVAEYNNNGVENFRLRDGAQSFPFKCATGIAVHPVNGKVYVADAGANKVFVFDATGVYLNISFGTGWGSNNANELGLPVDIVITDEWVSGVRTNKVLVVDASPTGLQIPIFSDAGVFEKALCGSGSGSGLNGVCQLTLPMGVAVEYTAGVNPSVYRVYATDPYQAAVIAIDPSGVSGSPGVYGNFLRYLGEYGADKGDLVTPAGVVFDALNKRLIIANGYGNLTFFPVDGGSNPISRDTILPIFNIDALPANNISTSTITITGTRESSDVKVAVSASTGAIPGATVYAPSGTAWSCTLTGLAEGRNEIYAQGRDAAGNIQTRSVTVYYTKPLTDLFVIDMWPEITASTSHTFTGTIASGATIVTNPATTCTYPTTTTWSCPVPLAEGPNTVTFTVSSNNKVTSANIIRDTTAPDLQQVYALATGDTTSTQVQNFSGIVTEANLDTVTIKVNSGAATPIDVFRDVYGLPADKAYFSVPVVLDRAGNNTIVIEAKDKVGNTSTDTRTISLNMAAPSVTISTPTDGKAVRSTSVQFSGAVDRDGSTCTINGNHVNVTNLTWSGSVTLADGFNNVVVACDNGGPISKVKRTIFYNQKVLELDVTTPGRDKSENVSSVGIKGSVDIATTTLLSTFKGETHAVPMSNGAFTLPVTFPIEGIYSYAFTTVDGTDTLKSVINRSMVYDTTAPSLNITYGNTSASTITGFVEPGARVEVKDFTNNTIGTVAMGADQSGKGTFTATLGQNYDLFALVVAATDQAGNITKIGGAKPDGDCSGNGTVAPDDASICLDMVAGITTPTLIEKAHCDVGPLVAGTVSPNGQMDISDCILIMRKASGLPPTWW